MSAPRALAHCGDVACSSDNMSADSAPPAGHGASDATHTIALPHSSSHLGVPASSSSSWPHDISWREAVRIEDEDALSSPVAVKDNPTLQVMGPHGLYFPPNTSILSRFIHLFPDTKSRLAAGLFVLAALAYMTAWMVATVRGRWINQRYTPVTTLSFESVQQLPAAHGLLSFFHMDTWWNNSLADSVDMTYYNESAIPINTPLPTYRVPAPVPPHHYVWQEFYLLGKLDEAVDQDVEAAYSCIPSTSPAISLAPVSWCTAKNYQTYAEANVDWPLQFASTLSRFCVRSYALFDERATVSLVIGPDGYSVNYNDFEYEGPQFKFSVMSLENMYRFYRMQQAGQDISSPITAGLYADPIMLPYQQRHGVSVRMRKTNKLDGSVQWTSDISYDNSRPFKQKDIDKAWATFFANNPALYASLQADPNIELNSSRSNFTAQYFTETCISPASFDIQVVTESTPYGFASFLGDLGGTLNIIALVLALAFPVANTLVQPRVFLGVWLMGKYRKWTGSAAAAGRSDSRRNSDHSGRTNGQESPEQREMRVRKSQIQLNDSDSSLEEPSQDGHSNHSQQL